MKFPRPRVSAGSRLRAALGWGVLWGAVLGTWAVYPHLLRTHHVHPDGAGQWALLGAMAVVIFGGIGAAAGTLVWAFVEPWLRIRGRPLRAPGWAFGLGVLLAVPPVYFAISAFAESLVFRSFVGLEAYRPFLPSVVGGYAAIAVACAIVYAILARADTPPRPAMLAAGGVGALAMGMALAPVWGETPRLRDVEVPPLERPRGARPKAPLLFVGIDSGSWRVARPLIEGGAVPTLGRIAERGLRGEVFASWRPVLSGPAWASIVTGHPRQRTGVFQEIVADVPGLPPFQIPLELDFLLDPVFLIEYGLAAAGAIRLAPLPRSVLRRPPFWERLAAAGLRVAVVRAPFTFPADGQAHVVVSDYVGEDAWKFLEVRARSGAGLASPPRLAESLVTPFAEPSGAAKALVARVLDGAEPPASRSPAPPGESLRVAAEIDQRTFEVTESLVRSEPGLDVVVAYVGGFDTVCHAFWQYRFPEDFRDEPVDAAAARELGPVIDRYLQFLDREIGRLIEAFPEPPIVVVASDHGHGPLYGNHIYTGGHSMRDGFFAAAGPGVPHRDGVLEVRYFDVAPTVLGLLGFAQPEDLEGVSLLAVPPGGASS